MFWSLKNCAPWSRKTAFWGLLGGRYSMRPSHARMGFLCGRYSMRPSHARMGFLCAACVPSDPERTLQTSTVLA
jgi:hypothetical protein